MRILAALLIACAVAAATLVAPSRPAVAQSDPAFRAFLESVWPEAQAQGVSRRTFDAAIAGLEPDRNLPDLILPGRTRPSGAGQAEFVQTPAQYLSEKTLTRLTAQGRKLYAEHRDTLRGIEREFGVPPSVLLAIWGRETGYGTFRLPHDGIRALATQAYLGRRKDQFRGEFVLALKMLEEGHVTRAKMRASWAGALGLTQFLPSDFYRYAVDFDRDGRRDIFGSVPDALASAAKQLVDKGWQPGIRWAIEVRAPQGLDCTEADPERKRPVREWLRRGFAPADGRPVSKADAEAEASLFLPAGTHGPAFLTLQNYFVFKGYNFADLYALFVGDLSDRIEGRGGFVVPWKPLVQLESRKLEAMQQKLAALGLYGDKIDGKAGMKTRLAVGAYQKRHGLTLDCWPDEALLAHLAQTAGR